MEEQLQERRKKVFRDVFLIALSILLAALIHQSGQLENLLRSTRDISFILGAFLAGIFFASTFTVALATSVFLILGQTHNPLLVALVGGLGAFLGDSLIFKFLKDDLIADFEYVEKYFPKTIIKRLFHSKMIFWFAPFIAAFVIASPLPDEVGLLMLASIKLRYHHFFWISFLLNTLGILVISAFGAVI